jgi:hypothetical protein
VYEHSDSEPTTSISATEVARLQQVLKDVRFSLHRGDSRAALAMASAGLAEDRISTTALMNDYSA